ncbi:hypothetical protein L1887_56811 [Cichorium endivia]|nr:hypothetical protein L1887_56811 [Cichorium endivia]
MLPDGGVKDRPFKQAKNGWGGHILIIASGAAYIDVQCIQGGGCVAARLAVVGAARVSQGGQRAQLGHLPAQDRVQDDRGPNARHARPVPAAHADHPRGGVQDRRHPRGRQEQGGVHPSRHVCVEPDQGAAAVVGAPGGQDDRKHGHVPDVRQGVPKQRGQPVPEVASTCTKSSFARVSVSSIPFRQ